MNNGHELVSRIWENSLYKINPVDREKNQININSHSIHPHVKVIKYGDIIHLQVVDNR